MLYLRGEPTALHSEFAPGSPASVIVHAEVLDVPRIRYSDVDEYALETFLRKRDRIYMPMSPRHFRLHQFGTFSVKPRDGRGVDPRDSRSRPVDPHLPIYTVGHGHVRAQWCCYQGVIWPPDTVVGQGGPAQHQFDSLFSRTVTRTFWLINLLPCLDLAVPVCLCPYAFYFCPVGALFLY